MSKSSTKTLVAVGERLQPVGELFFEVSGGRQSSVFRYLPQWLENPERFAIAPSMPLGYSSTFSGSSHDVPGGALPGPIADSTPDSWGRGLIRHALVGELTELDYLLAVDDSTRQGSLRYLNEDGVPQASFHPPIPRLNELEDIRRIASAAGQGWKISDPEWKRLLGSAGSLGGARPKAGVLDELGELAIAKFTSDQDTMPVERAEVATLDLARAVGINAASARLELGDSDHPIALIKRFDRTRDERIAYLSAQSFLGVEAATGAFYTDIADMMRAHASGPKREMEELYRRILFTILVSNTDDHLKNHGLLHVGGGRWALAPAFDINPQPFRHRDLKTGISELSGSAASVEAAVEACPFFEVDSDVAVRTVAEMITTIDEQWRERFAAAGMTSEEVDRYAPAFDHEESQVARQIKARLEA